MDAIDSAQAECRCTRGITAAGQTTSLGCVRLSPQAIEHPYEPLALALLAGWMKLALADERHAALLAPPLIDVIGRVPKPRIPRVPGINWPLEPRQAHTRPRRR
jgi:hypothetical protein